MKYKVTRETLVVEEFEVEALNPDQALRAVKVDNRKPNKSNSKILKYKIEEPRER